jgi:hypothetical protein
MRLIPSDIAQRENFVQRWQLARQVAKLMTRWSRAIAKTLRPATSKLREKLKFFILEETKKFVEIVCRELSVSRAYFHVAIKALSSENVG